MGKPPCVKCERCVFLCTEMSTVGRCLCRCGQLDVSSVLVQAHWSTQHPFPAAGLLTPECTCPSCQKSVKALLPLLSKSEKDIQISFAGELGSLNWEKALKGD
jgi:hypothetical protein